MNTNRPSRASQSIISQEIQFRVPVLLVVSNPLDPSLSPIDFQGEIRQLDRAGLPIAFVRLNPPTWLGLENMLQRTDFSILHFIGHGNEEGIYLEKPNGQADFIRSNALAQIVQNSKLQLVILETCDSWGYRTRRRQSHSR